MGNGRRLGKSSGSSSESGLVWVRVLAAVFVLLLAGFALLGSASRRYVQKALAPIPASPIPSAIRSSLHSKQDARALLGQLPLIFEPNQGQADPQVKFLARGAGYNLFLDTTGALLALQTSHSSPAGQSEQFVRMKLAGANPSAAMAGTVSLPGRSNYLVGNDPHQWHKDIPQFAGVHYDSVYPGIDLVFYGNQGHLEYDFRVAPGADPSQAELQFDGATRLELSGGDLILTGLASPGNKNNKDEGGLRLQAPQVYQRDGDRRNPVAGHFVLRAANRVGFEIGPYDRSRELIIDPVLVFSTYFGGTGSETSPSVAVDGAGNIYLVGSTTSPQTSFTDYANTAHTSIPSTLQITTTGGSHIFVAKINPLQPPSVVYETFLGGSGSDTSIGIAVDNGGLVYIAGNTTSTNFPTSLSNILGYQTAPETKGTQCAAITCTSVFVSVLNSVGSGLNYSSYLSGNGNDQASGMTIDLNQDVFVTGTTSSTNVPSLNDAFPATLLPVPFQTSPAPGSSVQFFVTKLDTNVPSVGGIFYSTYFGGGTPSGALATGGGVAVDTTGNIYFSGTTNFYNSGSGVYGDSGQSEDFPILNAYQPCLDTPPPTILNNPNPCTAPATPYPTDAFVAKINPNTASTGGAQLLFSTYLGGTATDSGPAIAIDSGAANIYLAGSTNSSDFVIPTGSAAFQSCLDTPPVTPPIVTCPVIASPAPFDAYVARMGNPTASTTGTPNNVALTYFSYLGGSGNDSANALAVLDSSSATLDDIVVAGSTSSTNFPVTPGAIQSTLNGAQNAFFAHLETTTVTGQTGIGSYATYFGGNGTDSATSLAVDTSLNTYLAGTTTSTNLQTDNPLQSTLTGTSDAFVVKLGTATALSLDCVTPCVSPTGVVSAGNQVTITFTITNEGPDPAVGTSVSGTVPAGVTFNSATAGSGTCSAPANNVVICQIPTLQAGSTSPVTFVVTPIAAGSFQATAQIFNVNNTSTNISNSASFTASSFSVHIAPSGQTVAAGLTAPFNVEVSPSNGVFGANVSLTCSALPTGSACDFANSTISLNGASSGSTALSLTTTAQPTTTISSTGWHHPLYAFWLTVPGMALLGLGAGGKRGNKRLLGLLMLCVLFALVLLQPSCSGGKTQPTVAGTPSGTYSLTVTATSGSFSQSVPFSLTVTP